MQKEKMMLAPCNCFLRKCKHYIGIGGEDGEQNDIHICKAFPEGIPEEIAYGDDLHTEPFSGDHGILFEAKQ